SSQQPAPPGQHQRHHSPGELVARAAERPYKCKQCPRSYRHAGSLVNHRRTHEVGLFCCLLCHKDFSNPMALKSHLRTHTEEKRYKCRDCGRSFRAFAQLSGHHCLAFRLPSELLSHQKAHDEDPSQAVGLPAWEGSEQGVWEEDSIETSAKLDIYQPPPAGTHFGDSVPCSLKDASKAGGGERCNPDGELCIRCGGAFASDEELKGHSCLYPEEADEEEEEEEGSSPLLPERPFRCGDCGRTYRHAGSLINHKKSHQTGVYSCSVCSKQLYNLAALKNHLRVHLKSKLGSSAPEEASQHAAGLSGPPRLENSPGDSGECHPQPPEAWRGASCPKEEEERGAGDEERPYRCTDCGRSYRHRGSLVNHRHTHQTGVFQCSICPKQYSNLMALRNHVRVHLRAARLRGRDFEEEAEFQLHQLRHLPCTEDIEVAAIPRLGIFLPQEADLLQAIRQDVEALENGTAVVEDVLPSSEMAHACPQCGMTFASVDELQNHTLQHRSEGEAGDQEEEQLLSHICGYCGQTF
uniref:C2H2-type domain-containing protein n=1 Tax=Podarcis muralis TaxID=64176 RepID=A0A670JLA7_PODMU